MTCGGFSTWQTRKREKLLYIYIHIFYIEYLRKKLKETYVNVITWSFPLFFCLIWTLHELTPQLYNVQSQTFLFFILQKETSIFKKIRSKYCSMFTPKLQHIFSTFLLLFLFVMEPLIW